MSALGGLGAALGPIADSATKQAKAGKLKSLKVKAKFDNKGSKPAKNPKDAA